MSTAETLENTPHSELSTTADPADAQEGHSHEGHSHPPASSFHPELTREVEVEIPAEEVSAAFRAITKRYARQARIPGFRIGKVPPTLIRSRFHEEIRQEVVEAVLPAHFRSTIEKAGLRPVSQPQVTELHLSDGEPLKFKASFEVLPAIDITGYQDVKVARPEVALTEEEFEAELERVKETRSTMEPVTEERALEQGDWAQISFTGAVKTSDQPAEAGASPNASSEASPEGSKTSPDSVTDPVSGEDLSLEVGGKNTLPAFTEALRGATVGQELKFEVAYPADFGEPRLAGKTIAYDVEVKGIKRKIEPEFNDEFAKELGEYESFDEFKHKLREHLLENKRERLAAEVKDGLLAELAGRYRFPVPESLVRQQIDARLERGLRALAEQGMREEDMRKLDFARLREAQRDAAVNEVKGILLLDRIAEEEKIEVSDDELEEELEMISLQAREPLESLRTRLTEDGGLSKIREQMRREKVGNLLYERLGA